MFEDEEEILGNDEGLEGGLEFSDLEEEEGSIEGSEGGELEEEEEASYEDKETGEGEEEEKPTPPSIVTPNVPQRSADTKGGFHGSENTEPIIQQKPQQSVIDDFIKRQYNGAVNPYTGRVIDSEAELNIYKEGYVSEERNNALKNAGIAPEVFNQLIESNPTVKKAQGLVRELEQEKINNHAKNQLLELNQKFPDCGIKTPNDLEACENAQEILNLWAKGISLAQAYGIVNMDRLMNKKSEAVKQMARNEINSKKHMTQTKGKASEPPVSVPKETYDMYKRMLPNWTDKQIREDYARSMGK